MNGVVHTPAAIAAALRETSIIHGDIGLMDNRNNLTYSDRKNIFIKVTRPGFPNKQLETELSLALEYGSEIMLEPLYDSLIPVGSSSLSIWKYEELKVYENHNLTPSNAYELALELTKVHHLARPTKTHMEEMKDFGRLKNTIEMRIAVALENGMEQKYINILRALSKKFLERKISSDNLVLNHGDTHVGNSAYRKQLRHAAWFDFESARLAPREFDVATLRTNLLLVGKNPKAWEAALEVFSETPLNESYMELFTVSRLISMTSYLLLHTVHYSLAIERLTILEKLLSGSQMPLNFPSEIS